MGTETRNRAGALLLIASLWGLALAAVGAFAHPAGSAAGPVPATALGGTVVLVLAALGLIRRPFVGGRAWYAWLASSLLLIAAVAWLARRLSADWLVVAMAFAFWGWGLVAVQGARHAVAWRAVWRIAAIVAVVAALALALLPSIGDGARPAAQRADLVKPVTILLRA